MSYPRNQRKSTRPGWEKLANWYNGWVGQDGSKYHQQVALPNLLSMLKLQKGERLLDLGCGTGILARHTAQAGATYIGVDISPKMIELCQRQQANFGDFMLASASKLPAKLQDASFDAAVFMLSIQDMPDYNAALAGASAALKPGGRLVIFMLHPAFRVPRQSGWGIDPKRKLKYRRIDSYLNPLAVPLTNKQGVRSNTTYHRPLMDYVNTLGKLGLMVNAMQEVADTKVNPAGENPTIPMFIAIKAVKVL